MPSNAVKFAAEVTGVRGYVAVWNVLSSDKGGYFVLLPPNSVVFPNYEIVLMYNHNEDYILACESNGSLRVSVDDYGVLIEATLDNTFIDEYVKTKVGNQTIKGMSFGCFPITSHFEKRTITEIDASGNPLLAEYIGQTVDVEVYDSWLLDETTITALPSFPQSSVSTFNKLEEVATEKKNEEGIKDKSDEVSIYEYEAILLSLELE